MPLLKNHRLVAAAIETTMGTAVSTSSGCIANAYDLTIDADISYNERRAQGSFSRLQGTTGTRSGSMKFKIDGYGSGTAGTAPAWATTLLVGCGFTQASGVFSLTSSLASMKTLTLGAYEDGLYKELYGAMGSVTCDFVDGKPSTFSFDFKGVWAAPTDVALLSPTYSAQLPPDFMGATLTIGSYTPLVSKLSIKVANTVELRNDATQATGFISAVITDREITGSLDPEASTVATHDAFGIWLAGTTAALTATVGASGSGFSFGAPALQAKSIKEGDRGGIQTHDQDFVATCGTTADSELTLTF